MCRKFFDVLCFSFLQTSQKFVGGIEAQLRVTGTQPSQNLAFWLVPVLITSLDHILDLTDFVNVMCSKCKLRRRSNEQISLPTYLWSYQNELLLHHLKTLTPRNVAHANWGPVCHFVVASISVLLH